MAGWKATEHFPPIAKALETQVSIFSSWTHLFLPLPHFPWGASSERSEPVYNASANPERDERFIESMEQDSDWEKIEKE